MSTQTTIRTVIRKTPGGRFIATAIDHPGVVTFADTEEKAKEQLGDAWLTMYAWKKHQNDVKLEEELLKYSDGGVEVSVSNLVLNIVNA